MKASSLLSLGAIAAVFVTGATYMSFGVVRVDWLTRYDTFTMALPDSAGLVPRSAVLLSGVKVGEVAAVSVANTGAQVRLRVRDDYRIPAASSVSIEQLSALGEPYVEFVPSGAGGAYLRDGQRIDTAKLTAPPSIPQMARAVTDLLAQVDPKSLAALVDTFHQGLSGTEAIVPELSRSTDLLAATLLSRTPQLRALMSNLQALGADIDWMGADMTAGGPYWGQFGVGVKQVVDTVESVFRVGKFPDDYVTGTGLAPLLPQLDCRLQKIGPDLLALAPALRPAVADATDVAARIDLGSLISQAVHATGDGRSLKLSIDVK